MLERDFQPKLIKEIESMLPGCIVLKNDSGYLQGIPDLSIFYGNKYAMLEVKKSENEPYQPNQEYYLDYISREMGAYTATIYPENKEEVLDELQQALRLRGRTRVSKRK